MPLSKEARQILSQLSIEQEAAAIFQNYRMIDGKLHASRVAAYIPMLVNFCRVKFRRHTAGIRALFDEEIKLLQLAALFQDVAQEADDEIAGADAAVKFQEYLRAKGINDPAALDFAKYILREKKDNLSLLFESATELDNLRFGADFNIVQIPLYLDSGDHVEQRNFMKLTAKIKTMIAAQEGKQTYEQASDCYQQVAAATKKLYSNESKSEEDKHETEVFFDTPCAIKLQRGAYKIKYRTEGAAQRKLKFLMDKLIIIGSRSIVHDPADPDPFSFELTQEEWSFFRTYAMMSAPRYHPVDDFFIKSLRADEFNFVREFFETIIPPNNSGKPLRIPAQRNYQRSNYTVTGGGVFHLVPGEQKSEQATDKLGIPYKKPQYSPNEKAGYSKAQSTSWASPDHHAVIFGYGKGGDERSVLSGVLIDEKDVLLTDRNFIYDSATIKRNYDFYSLSVAQAYAQDHIGVDLFSKTDFDKFKQAVMHSEDTDEYNEAMVRLRWNPDQSSKIFIGSSNFASVLQAMENARLLKARLIAKGAVSQDYNVPIIVYAPQHPDIHLKIVDEAFCQLIKIEALAIYYEPQKRMEYFLRNEYQILFALSKEEIFPALINQVLPGGRRLIHHILSQGYVHILESLADKCGISFIDLVDRGGALDPVTAARVWYHLYRTGHIEEARFLEGKQPEFDFNHIDANGGTLLLMAAANANLALFTEVKRRAVNINHRNRERKSALLVAVDTGELAMVQELLADPKLDPNLKDNEGNTALILAASKGYIDIFLELLKDPDIDVTQTNASDKSALSYISANGDLACVRALLDKSDFFMDVPIAAIYAATYGKTDILLEFLTRFDFDINFRIFDNQEKSLITAAAYYGQTETVRALLNKKIDVNLKERNGNTALMIAVERGHLPTVELLLTVENIKVNAPKESEFSPLIYAVINQQKQILTELLKHQKIKINRQHGSSHKSALHYAVECSSVDYVELLLKHGADITLKTEEKETAKDIAIRLKRHDIVFMLNFHEQKQKQPIFQERAAAYGMVRQLADDEKVADKRKLFSEFNVVDKFAVRLIQIYQMNEASKDKNIQTILLRLKALIVESYNAVISDARNLFDKIPSFLEEGERILTELRMHQPVASKLSIFASKVPAQELDSFIRDLKRARAGR